MNQPLIVTVRLDESSFDFFNTLRKQFFPPEKNFLSAHLTLFHHLPPNEPSIQKDLAYWSMSQQKMILETTAVKNIGKGVVYKIECLELLQLHSKMQKQWRQWLTLQDKQKLWPHITVQNKVSVQQAIETCVLLKEKFIPFEAKGIGFDVWSYENGPWRFIEQYPFAVPSD